MLNRPPAPAAADTTPVLRGLGAKLPPKLTSILPKPPFRPPSTAPSTPSSPAPVAVAASNATAPPAARDVVPDPSSKVKKMHTGSSTTSSTATATATTNPSDPVVSVPVASAHKPSAGLPFSPNPLHQHQHHNHHMHHMHHHPATTTAGTTAPPWVQQLSGVTSTTPAAVPTPVATAPAPLPAVPPGVMHVVILGGSFSGLSVAVTLAKITRNSQASSAPNHHAHGAGGGGFGAGLGGGNHHRNSTNSTTSTSSNGNPNNGGGGLMPTHNRDRAAVHITLVEPKTYLEVRWSTIRSLFDAGVCDASTVPLSKVLAEHAGTITHVCARGKAVLLDTVVLDDGRHIPYDVLLIATGAVTAYAPLTPHLTPSSSPSANTSATGTPLRAAEAVRQSRDGNQNQDEDQGHGSLAQRRLFLQQTGAAILQGRSVAIVGGGPVGTELAADIAAYARQHQQQRPAGASHEFKVTLIDSNDKLMPGYPRAIAQKLRDKLAALHVRVILGHSAVRVSGGEGDSPGTTGTGTTPEVWELYPCDKTGSSTSGNGRSGAKDGHHNQNYNNNNYYYSNGYSKGKGKRLDADLVICATGVRPCEKGFFEDGQVGGAESVRDGWIRTDRFGRVIGCRGDVFAAGDCCDWAAKSGENTLANRHTYAHNVRVTCDAIANNRALASIDSKLRRVSTSHRPAAVVASQPRDGETTSAFAALSPSWWWMKNRGMLLAKAQREIGW